jgi:PAS domain S-box-containing protein
MPQGGLDSFFIAAPCGLAILDANLRYVRINETLAQMNCLTVDEHFGKDICDVVPKLAPVIEPVLRRVLSTGEPVLNIEVSGRASDPPGERQHRVASYFPIRESDGAYYGIGAIEIDITDRKRAEERLVQTLVREQFLSTEMRLLLESTAEGIFGLDVQGHFTFLNKAGAEMLGFTPQEVLGKDAHALVHHSRPDGSPYPAEECPILQTLRTGQGRRLDDEVLWRRDGTGFPTEFSSHPIFGEGVIRGAVVTFVDITGRKRAQDALRTRVRQQEVVAKLGLLALQGADLDTLLNASVARITQILDVEYCKVLELLPDGNTLLLRSGAGWKNGAVGRATEPAGLESPAGYALRSAAPMVVEDLGKETRFTPSPLLAEHGVVSGVDVIIFGSDRAFGILGVHTTRHRTFTDDDINFLQAVANVLASAIDHRQAAERLQALSRRLVEVQETVQRTIARELHDEIGQTLTALKIILETTSSEPGDAPGLRRARTLAHDLLGKVRSLSLDLRPAVLDDLGLVPALVLHCDHYTAQTGVHVDLEHAEMEGRRFPSEVETAAYRIAQEALTNVARHAGVAEATVRLWIHGSVLSVQIEDAGAGFDPAPALAMPHSSGLVGMRERARLLNGELTVESAPGSGTRVTAELPFEGSGMEGP